MMHPKEIQYLEEERARRASAKNLQPYVVFDENEVSRMPPFPFPNIGSYRPEGWELEDELFCDSSGWGADDEPALSYRQLKLKLLEHLAEDKAYGYAVISEGQFQIQLGVFVRTSKKHL